MFADQPEVAAVGAIGEVEQITRQRHCPDQGIDAAQDHLDTHLLVFDSERADRLARDRRPVRLRAAGSDPQGPVARAGPGRALARRIPALCRA